MNLALKEKLIKQQLQKNAVYVIPNVLDSAFSQQIDFIKDPAKRKVACCSRRGGKSTAVGMYLINECLKTKCNCLYIARTKESAENIMWNDIIDVLVKKYHVKCKPGISKLTLKFSNGSILYLTGADANEKQMRSLVGKKYNLVVIDECQSFTNDLGMLVNKVLMPTLGDFNATICLIGTVGNDQSDFNFWYKVVSKKEPGWSVHTWNWRDNPIVRDNIQQQINDLIKSNPKIIETDWYRQEYEGIWLSNSDARIYHSSTDNYIDIIPNFKKPIYNLSIDLGFVDATTFCITVYDRSFNNCLYVLESSRHTKLTVTDVANTVKQYQQKYQFHNIIVDAANLQVCEEIRQVHGLYLQEANKRGKEAHIAMLNADFQTKNVLILKAFNQQLIHELETLTRDQKAMEKGQWKEDQRKKNDLCDSLLYNHTASRHYWFQPIIAVNPNSEDQIRQAIYNQHLKSLNIKNSSLEVDYQINEGMDIYGN